MKMRVMLIILLVIQIIYSGYTVIISDKMVNEMIQAFSLFDSMYPDSNIMDIISKYGIYLILGSAISIMVIGIIMLLIVLLNKEIGRMKRVLLGLSIISLLMAHSDMVMLISIINIIMVGKIPSVYDKQKVVREIPNIEDRKSSKKEIILAIFMILIYFILLIDPFNLYLLIPSKFSLFYMIFTYLFLMGVAIIFFYKELRMGFLLFWKNKRAYIKFLLPKVGLMYLTYFIVAIIVFGIYQGTTVNQSAIYSLPKALSIFLAVIYAPIVEEVVFRGSIRRLIRNKWVYIIVSGFIFGIIHTIGEASVVKAIVLSIPYSVIGGYFAYIYYKSNNISTNIICHMMHNMIASVAILLM